MIFNQLLKTSFEYTNDPKVFSQASGVKIGYGLTEITQVDISIPKHNLLFETKINPQLVKIQKHPEYPRIFELEAPNHTFSFDLFAAVFYLISRYEEYLPFEADQHQRFSAKQSATSSLISIPIVHVWVNALRKQINKFFTVKLSMPAYQFNPTYDIDFAWAFRQKGFLRTVGSLAKALLRGETSQIPVLLGKKTDPYDVYEYLNKIHQKYNLLPIYFWLLGDRSTYDKNHAPDNRFFKALIQQVSTQYTVGIHPSYTSNTKEGQLKKEIKRLQQIIGQPVVHSRQHFLKLRFPDTYRALLKQGIKHDYTMGYAESIGFRAGIAIPYKWFDLAKNESTELTVHPFQVMDVTLKKYQQLSPEEGVLCCQKIIDQLHEYGGTFTLLWHNSSLSYVDDWQEWATAFEKIVHIASQNNSIKTI